ncbi:class I SAM-dependent methyltransferase [Paraconexibacter antarcticus]|uniref:Class I SAM-dependent methyltransferase n=1 Tax=Paraconexibacter antarcticus TaxID=2949664 RepID=A0ABY5DZ98_9ACTN|nr:class I SAM-dependent methyltransferase [Paraconexibacter antarcticus]UTI65889.1 class I SAM-dependent methyltransferase [Paraconexibacter antarcticus]
MSDITAMKEQARATWAAGDFDAVAELIWEAGGVAAAAAGCGPGDRVLDIAAGTGNAAVQAAQRGADVVASDLTPELFVAGRRRAEAAGVELEWVEADAEALPFQDASFDAAMSTFGIMFAPRQSVAAAELARVVRPGGRIALCAWEPRGFVGEMFRTVAGFLNPPPPVEAPPVRWGTEEGAHELLDAAFDITCEPQLLVQRFDAPIDEMTDHFMERFGPMVMARRALEPQGRWDEFLEAYRELARRWNEGGKDKAALPAGYLLVTGVRR